MSRYIDADALIESIKDTADLGGWIGEALYQIKQVAIKYIDSAPSIDIVRCKECKYWHRAIDESGTIERINFSKCTKGHYGNGLWFYCADGERREP